MAASAGTMLVQGADGRRYVIDMYLPDAVGGVVGFNQNGAATSTSSGTFRPTQDITVLDISVVTGTTAVGAAFSADGASFAGNVIRYANQLNTLGAGGRMPIGWRFRAGTLITATQI